MKRLRTAVLGVGYLGRFHAQKLKSLPNSELLGVYDSSFSRAQEVASELGVKAFERVADIFGGVDAVSIAAATQAHFELAQECLKRKIPCFVEKPIAASVDQARTLCRLASESKVPLQVGHIERFNPAFKALEALRIQPTFIECRRQATFKPRGVDVDVVYDLMIHDIDLVLKLTGSSVRTVSARGQKLVTPTQDWCTVDLEFENGSSARLIASRISPQPERCLWINGRTSENKDVSVFADLGAGQCKIFQKTGAYPENKEPGRVEEKTLEKADALSLELESFLKFVSREGTSSAASGAEGLRALELAEMILAKCNQ